LPYDYASRIMSNNDGGGELHEFPPTTSNLSHVSKETTAFEPGTVRILVADDHEVMRMGIRNLLESVPTWSVYAEAKTGREAVEAALASDPDIIIMDITMPEMNGLEAAARIATERPEIPVIMFSLHLSEDVITRFKSGSIRGAVAKSEAARDLLEAVKCVLAGGTFFPDKQMRSTAE
jgi:DNA-binding NarL/FixJ family response regulator